MHLGQQAIGSSSRLHLRQRRLGLRQPERHLHGPIQLNRGGQRSTRLYTASHLTIQRAEPETAVSRQWTHAELVGHDERVLIVGFGLFGLRGLAPRYDLAEEP
jgi:hypothetical protein